MGFSGLKVWGFRDRQAGRRVQREREREREIERYQYREIER